MQVSAPTATDFSRTQAPRPAWLAKAIAEPPLSPEEPIVDAHVHLWDHVTGYRYFAQEYAEDVVASGHDVQASIYVECNSMYRSTGPLHLRSVGETEFAVGMAAIGESGKYASSRIAAGIVAFADMTLGAAVGEVLDAHLDAGNGRVRGVRCRAKWDPDPIVKGAVSADRPGLYRDPAVRAGVAEVAARGLVFEASIYHPQIPDVLDLAEAVPEASIVLIHSGSPVGHSSYAGRRAQVEQDWFASMRELSRAPNVSVKLGGLLMPLANFDFGTAERPPTSAELADLWHPFIDGALDLFGADRCMVASNFPVEKAGVDYRTIWNMFKRLLADASHDERRAVLAGTANRIYGLGLPNLSDESTIERAQG